MPAATHPIAMTMMMVLFNISLGSDVSFECLVVVIVASPGMIVTKPDIFTFPS